MRRSFATLLVILLALPVLWASGTQEQAPAAKKRATSHSKPANAPAKHEEVKRTYAELTIAELVHEDPSSWSEKMGTHATVGGFVTQAMKEEDGDTDIRICENPKIEGMDRARCIEAKCIPKVPCESPSIGKPITIRGITRYDAKAGNHWWEINPVEQIEK
jgi:hypothetical protein